MRGWAVCGSPAGVEREQGIKLNPSDETIWMWHCANVGRDCQTRGMKDQIAAVGVMTEDLSTILNKLGRTEYSEAWQALAKMLYQRNWSADRRKEEAVKNAAKFSSGKNSIKAIADYAKALYENASTKSKADNNDYKALSAMQKGWK